MKYRRKASVNMYGLSRNISEEVKREIRQKSGFGCVICGFAICHYEHVDPEFKDAKVHDPRFMTLLCGRCNDRKMRGILSKEAVKMAMENPKALQDGFAFDTFDVGPRLPDVKIGDSIWKADENFVLLRINGLDLVKIEPPEIENGPFLLSANFYDIHGKHILWIKRNEWYGNTTNWDIETKGRSIIIRSAPKELELQITNIPNECLIINRINFSYKGYEIIGSEKRGISVFHPSGRRLFFARGLSGTCSGIDVVAFEINGDGYTIGKASSYGKRTSKVSIQVEQLALQ